jgi:hypothetical protein
LYVLVRGDLASTQIAVQAIHAAIEAARHFLLPDQPHPHLVLCRVNAERDLLLAADRLERRGIRFQLFREPDRSNEATALATEPLRDDRRAALARYPCLSRSDLLAKDANAEPRGPATRAADSGGCSEVAMT